MKSYEYFNSKDMSSYLEEQNYAFSPLETAWLIYMCDRLTFKEKHAAWQELIETTSDCEIPERMNCDYQPSLHEFLLKYMEVEDRSYEKFIETDGVYTFYILWEDENVREDGQVICSSYESCWDNIHGNLEGRLIHASRIVIEKYRMDQEDMLMRATFSEAGELFSIWDRTWPIESEENKLMAVSFDGMWFDFPTPFKKGDVLINKGKRGTHEPFVLKDIVTWDCRENIRRDGDYTDMCANGFFLSEDGTVYSENVSKYSDLEFYRGPKNEKIRVLTAISNFTKDRISVDMLLNAYRKIMLEYCTKDFWMKDVFGDEAYQADRFGEEYQEGEEADS